MKLPRAIPFVLAAAFVLVSNPVITQSRDVEIKTLSTRPETVSGGDALVQIALRAGLSPDNVTIAVAGRDVKSAFKPGQDARTLVGLVGGLQNGRNVLEVGVNGKTQARLTLTNHPITGPIISGPHQTPFVCETEALGLGPALDANCSAKTRVDYFYRSTTPPPARGAGGGGDALGAQDGRGGGGAPAFTPWKPFDPAAPRPADLAMTTTSEGKTVPYIVRREMGTINRAVYVIALLHEPNQPLPIPGGARGSWNGKLVYSFGGGCGAGYHQGASVGGLQNNRNYIEDGQLGDYAIAKGYAMAGGSLNVTGTSCADVISAETMMMVKEHFIDQFGLPIYTVGSGRSGGSMQQHTIGNNYPGLLDGIVPTASYADMVTFLTPLFDCELLENVYQTSKLTWTEDQRKAVNGQSVHTYCTQNGTNYPNLKATTNFNQKLFSPDLVYSASNPKGARFTYQDNMVNVFGRDPKTGLARRPFDNVGVQYGLGAFNAGVISFEQFLDLNSRVGGQDIDGNVSSQRMVADPDALRIMHQTGRVNDGSRGLSTIPIIDSRPYTDGIPNVHDIFAGHITRARLIAANGHANNQVMHVYANGMDVQKFQAANLEQLDRWVTNILRDTAPARTQLEKVVRNKPADVVDACYTETETITDKARCTQMFPVATNPRVVAGMPNTHDRFKCQLQPVDRKLYKQALTDAQLSSVKAVFPQGVCDYSKPGVSQRAPDTWLSYPQPGTTAAVGSTSN
jgi:hypothetical protein